LPDPIAEELENEELDLSPEHVFDVGGGGCGGGVEIAISPSSPSSVTAAAIVDTSCITVLESAHGHRRRVERSIGTHDLQRAVKYGQKEEQVRNGVVRWKFTYADVVYITDETTRHEVSLLDFFFAFQLFNCR
jgi:hypothetical protein